MFRTVEAASRNSDDILQRLTDSAPVAWFLPEDLSDRPHSENVRIRLLVLIAFRTFLAGFPFTVVFSLLDMPLTALVVFIGCLGIVPAPLLLHWDARLDLAANWTIFFFYAAVVTYLTGGVTGAAAPWLLLVLIYAFGTSRRPSAAWTSVSIATFPALLALQALELQPPIPLSEPSIAILTTISLFFLTGLVTMMFWVQRSVLQRLQRREQELEFEARYDPLTGLPNRLELRDRLEERLRDAGDDAPEVLLAYLDVDRFKVVNESLGHAAGNELLEQAAERLESLIQEGGTVERVAGDEFMILETGDRCENSEGGGVRIRRALEPSFSVADSEVDVTASIGIATPDAELSKKEGIEEMADAMARAADRRRVDLDRRTVEKYVERA